MSLECCSRRPSSQLASDLQAWPTVDGHNDASPCDLVLTVGTSSRPFSEDRSSSHKWGGLQHYGHYVLNTTKNTLKSIPKCTPTLIADFKVAMM